MISADVDLKELERSLVSTAAMFGEANETGIARWGVAVCRRLITVTQPWGENAKKAKEAEQKAMLKDVNRAFVVVTDPKLVRRLKAGKLGGLHVKGVFHEFRPHQQIKTGAGVNLFVEANRKGSKMHVPKLGPGMRCITTGAAVKSAMVVRNKRVLKGKGGWIGAGLGIAKFQKAGSRLTIGKNVGGVAHKWKAGGTAGMKKDTWNPEGTLANNFKHVSESYVLKPGDIEKAISDGAKNTITWYEKAMNGRLNRKK